MPEVNIAEAPPGLTTPKTSAGAIWGRVFLVTFFALLWFEAIHHLRSEWSFNPQYSYGWSVPLLIAYLLWRRWSERPPATAPAERTGPTAFIILCTFLILPIRFVAEANPDWLERSGM